MRILIVRLGALGDIVHALPALAALYGAYRDRVATVGDDPETRAYVEKVLKARRVYRSTYGDRLGSSTGS